MGNMYLAESIPTPSMHTRTLRSDTTPIPGNYMPTPPDVVVVTQDTLRDNIAFCDFGVGLWPDDYGYAFMSEQEVLTSNFYYGMDNAGDRSVGW